VQFPELAPINREQVDFTVSQLQSCITQLVQGYKTPFIHFSSYQSSLPHHYQDLLGVVAMYLQNGPSNQALTFSMLDRSVARLVDSSCCWNSEELLLATQALLCYQIIRLFDGDIRQRANAERQLPLLEAWASCLQKLTEGQDNTPLSHKSSHERWVVFESARRTVVVTAMLKAVYFLLKDGQCSMVPFMSVLPVSMDASRWNLTADEWTKASIEKPNQLVSYREYLSKWYEGIPLQFGAYESIILVACKHNAKVLAEMPTS
jgi:hypothetical protein